MSSMACKDEAEWESSQSPRLMLLNLKDRGEQGLLNRELRLFSCACCRHIPEYLVDERSSQAVDVAERFADGDASRDELNAAFDAAELAVESVLQRIKQINSAAQAGAIGPDTEDWRLYEIDDWHPEGRRENAARAVSRCADIVVYTSGVDSELKTPGDWNVARGAALYAYMAAASRDKLESMEAAFLAGDKDYPMYEDGWQADLIRCVFRNPFRPAGTDKLDVNPRIRDMAESIYRLRAFDRVPVLGKELEDSGCEDPELVSHCVNAPVHARGCWALDMARGFNRIGKVPGTD